MKINVLPSDNIFEELGHNTYDYKDLLSELIDNSLAARDGKSVRVHLDLFVDKDQRPHRFAISDDAAGIPAEIDELTVRKLRVLENSGPDSDRTK